MLPQYHHDHDKKWLNEKLSMCLSHLEREKVCEAYSKVYKEVFDAEPVEYRKEGRARFAANTRLRVYCGKKSRVFN